MSISEVIVNYVSFAISYGGYMEMDRLYLQNRILGMIGENQLENVKPNNIEKHPVMLVEQLVEQAVKNQKIDDTKSARDIFEAQLMDFITPPPSVINAIFAQHYQKSPEEATDYFYQLSKENDYVKTKAIAKNVVFPAETEYGTLEITINLSKPEKDPKDIAKAKLQQNVTYPKCMLCMENEGYLGRSDYPARTNHRIIRMNLQGESWGFQYSPYAYYNEHCIILAEKHRPMKISEATFRRLLEIVNVFPHYFVGSNADLPIVGGSILSHDHYQGGRHEFPMAKAPVEKEYALKDFPKVKVGKVKWPMSVLRLESENKEEVIKAATYILEKWQNYSDETVDVLAKSQDGTLHHTVTPIARKVEKAYQLDLVLRDNHTSKAYPDGVFHPHANLHHIKKENIGLIEVMGLAVLPPRLKPELKEVEKYLLGQTNEMVAIHEPWAADIKEKYATITKENVQEIVEKEVGEVFKAVLLDAGVFKRDEKGQQAFDAFVTSL